MKFVIIGPTYPFRGGISHYTTLLVRHLRAQHEARFYSYARQYPRWLFPGSVENDPSIQILHESCERTIDTLNPWTWWQTARRIVTDKPDALLLQWWTPFWLPLLLVVSFMARRARIPIIYLCHQLVEPDSTQREWPFARLGLRWSDGLIILAKKDYDLARQTYPHKAIRLGHLPILDGFPQQGLTRCEARQRLGIAAQEPLLLFFGFVRRYKGLRYLVEALGHVSDSVRLVVAGDFWEPESDYRQLIAHCGLQERVIIHNRYIHNEEIESYFVAADALVLPYLSSGSQSAVCMAAIHYGLPVIATSVGGLAETVIHEQTGLIVPPADSAALAAAIERFFAEDLHQSLRAPMAAARERLSWAALICIIEEMSRKLKATTLNHA
jgi:glycosyltransferase involved in cell wall biosynthesis